VDARRPQSPTCPELADVPSGGPRAAVWGLT
jgi:hypothetical protein